MSKLKRAGAIGIAVLILNELRGLLVVASLLSAYNNGALAVPHTTREARALIGCMANPLACTPVAPPSGQG